VVAYSYSGYEISPGQLSGILEMVDAAAMIVLAESGDLEHDALLAMVRTLMYGAGASGGVFLIDGYDDFDDLKDYSGVFETWSLSASHNITNVSAFYSYADKCQAFGIKYGVSVGGMKKRISYQ